MRRYDDPDPYDPLTEGGINVDLGGGMYGGPVPPDPPQVDTGQDKYYRRGRRSGRRASIGGGTAGPFTSDWFTQTGGRNLMTPPAGVPTAEQEALQQPMIDPTLIPLAMVGGEGITGLSDIAEMAAKDVGWQGLFGAAMSAAGGADRGITEAPINYAVPSWFEPKAPNERIFPLAQTTPILKQLRSGRGQPDPTTHLNMFEKPFFTEKAPPGTYGYPEYRSKLPPLYPVGSDVPDPKSLIYHALSTDKQHNPITATETALGKLPSIMEKGLEGGWFSEERHSPFGPLHVATKPPKDWSLDPRVQHLAVDPRIELSPKSYGQPIPPHELFLMDHEGNLLGRLGDPAKATEYWQRQAQPQPDLFDEENIAKAKATHDPFSFFKPATEEEKAINKGTIFEPKKELGYEPGGFIDQMLKNSPGLENVLSPEEKAKAGIISPFKEVANYISPSDKALQSVAMDTYKTALKTGHTTESFAQDFPHSWSLIEDLIQKAPK